MSGCRSRSDCVAPPRVCPGFSRSIGISPNAFGWSMAAPERISGSVPKVNATSNERPASTPTKPAGVTPTMVNGTPSMSRGMPTTFLEPASVASILCQSIEDWYAALIASGRHVVCLQLGRISCRSLSRVANATRMAL